MKTRCPYCGVDVNEYNLEKHKKEKCPKKVKQNKYRGYKSPHNIIGKPNNICPYCNTILRKKLAECHFCHKKLSKNIIHTRRDKNHVKSTKKEDQKTTKPTTAISYKPIKITATVKIPRIEKNIKELDGSYGTHNIRENGKNGSHPTRDDYS